MGWLFRHKYWLVQLVGWTGYFLLGMIMIAGTVAGPLVAVVMLVKVILLALTSHILRSLIKAFDWLNLAPLALAWRLLLVCSLLAIAFVVMFLVLYVEVFHLSLWRSFSSFIWTAEVVQNLMILMLWSALYCGYHLVMRAHQQKLTNLKLQLEVKDAELSALKSQLNPHFLFNCLNNIRATILLEPDSARNMLTQLSDLLRYAIQFNQKEQVTLQDEIDIVEDYLQLERVQFENRLSYQIVISDHVKSYLIPPMSIQLLVENALKHGIAQLPNGGLVIIEAEGCAGDLQIKVTNSGTLHSQSEHSAGVGIANLRRRLALLFGDCASVSLEQLREDAVCAQICISKSRT